MRYLIFVVALVACVPAKPPVVQVDPADPVSCGTPSCGTACANLRAHHCSLGDPTPKGASCEVVCDNIQVNNAGAGFPVVCLTRAVSCAAAEACR